MKPQIAIEKGFHSLVQVLLECGAEIEYSSYENVLLQAPSGNGAWT